MYNITIRVEVDTGVFPNELKNTELAELVVESAIGCVLQNLFTTVTIKEVSISPSPRDGERDWDALLSQDL